MGVRDSGAPAQAKAREIDAERFRKNRLLRERVTAKMPSSDVVGGFESNEVYDVVLRWQLATDLDHFALKEGLHFADLSEVSQAFPLTSVQVDGLVGAMVVEDHIPGYGDEYTRLFPVQGIGDPCVRRLNRRFRTLMGRWVDEETSHADGFLIVLLLSNAGDVSEAAQPDVLMDRLDVEAFKPYVAPFDHPGGLFAYTCTQEHATGLYYGALLEGIENPIVRAWLERVREQESRHCTMFAGLLRQSLAREEAKTIAAIQELLVERKFEMPLARMVDDYKRMAVRMRRAAPGYNAEDGLKALESQVRKVAAAKSSLRDHPVHALVAMMAAQMS